MKALFSAAAGLVFGVALAATPASAKAGDAAWAKCVWATAPHAAAAWLAMELPTWSTDFAAPNVLLGHRLLATCDDAAANPLKPNRMPKWKSVAATLRKAEPRSPAAPAEKAPEVALCQSRVEEDGQSYVYLYEVVRGSGASEAVAFRQYYGRVDGRAVKLPQDLRMVPGTETATVRTCQLIGDKGELIDA